jgi:hypothetical protein
MEPITFCKRVVKKHENNRLLFCESHDVMMCCVPGLSFERRVTICLLFLAFNLFSKQTESQKFLKVPSSKK